MGVRTTAGSALIGQGEIYRIKWHQKGTFGGRTNLQVIAVVDGGGAYIGHHLALDLVIALRDDVIEIESSHSM